MIEVGSCTTLRCKFRREIKKNGLNIWNLTDFQLVKKTRTFFDILNEKEKGGKGEQENERTRRQVDEKTRCGKFPPCAQASTSRDAVVREYESLSHSDRAL